MRSDLSDYKQKIAAIGFTSRGGRMSADMSGRLEKQMEHIILRSNQLEKVSDKDLFAATHGLKQQLKQNPSDETTMLDFISCTREAVFRTLGIHATTMQTLAVLEALQPTSKKSVFSEMHSGEGKTLVLAMEAAVLGAKGHKVDVLTSNNYLAERDFKHYQEFWRKMGFKADAVKSESATAVYDEADILYCSLHHAAEHSLFNGVQMKGKRGQRPRDVALVDEVDHLAFDQSNRFAILGNSKQSQPWIYHGINHFIDSSSSLKLGNLDKFVADARKALMKENGANQDVVSSLSDKTIADLLDGALTAKSLKLGVDFEIVADKDGRKIARKMQTNNPALFKDGERWELGVQNFLHDRYGLEPLPKLREFSSVTSKNFLKSYQHLYGMSGTFGDEVEAAELAAKFDADVFFNPNGNGQRVDLEPVAAENRDSHFAEILKQIKQMQEAKRPVLVSFKDERTLRAFGMYLEENQTTFSVLDGKDGNKSAAVIAEAGKPGAITLTTPFGGRGINIEPTKEALESGGLMSVVTYIPRTIRYEEQLRARAARKGSPGSSVMVIDKSEINISPEQQEMPIAEVIRQKQKDATKVDSITRVAREKIEDRLMAISGEYLGMLEGYHKLVEQDIAKQNKKFSLKNLLKKLPVFSRIFKEKDGELLNELQVRKTFSELTSDAVDVWDSFAYNFDTSMRQKFDELTEVAKKNGEIPENALDGFFADTDKKWGAARQEMQQALLDKAKAMKIKVDAKFLQASAVTALGGDTHEKGKAARA